MRNSIDEITFYLIHFLQISDVIHCDRQTYIRDGSDLNIENPAVFDRQFGTVESIIFRIFYQLQQIRSVNTFWNNCPVK